MQHRKISKLAALNLHLIFFLNSTKRGVQFFFLSFFLSLFSFPFPAGPFFKLHERRNHIPFCSFESNDNGFKPSFPAKQNPRFQTQPITQNHNLKQISPTFQDKQAIKVDSKSSKDGKKINPNSYLP